MVKKGTKNKKEGTKKGSYSLLGLPKLTKTEAEVLYYIQHEFLNTKQISKRRETTTRNTNKIIKKIREKGYLSIPKKKVPEIGPSTEPKEPNRNQIRLHGQEFNIKILYNSDKYAKTLKNCNLIYIDENTIKLNQNSIEVYLKQSFLTNSVDHSFIKSLKYLEKLITRLESDLNIVLVKDRYQNIKMVNAHFAEIHNGLARDYNENGKKFKIYAKEDGKLWFVFDDSYTLDEAEWVHPITNKVDASTVKEFFNDIRDNEIPTMSKFMQMIYQMNEINKETAAGLNTIVNIMKHSNMNLHKETTETAIDIDNIPSYVG